jgi:hypothetical protein
MLTLFQKGSYSNKPDIHHDLYWFDSQLDVNGMYPAFAQRHKI